MARVLGTATLIPDANNEQTINIGITATWITITVVHKVTTWCSSEGKATSSYQHCQSIAFDKPFDETGYLVRVRDNTGGTYPIVASAKLKSFNTGSITLKEITAPVGTIKLLIEAGN